MGHPGVVVRGVELTRNVSTAVGHKRTNFISELTSQRTAIAVPPSA